MQANESKTQKKRLPLMTLPILPPMQTRRPRALTEQERHRRAVESQNRYRATDRGKYSVQKQNACRRGVPFLLSFEQWLTVWHTSGKYDKRGNKTADGYVMARYHDHGPYALGNVKIIPHAENVAERNALVADERRHRWQPEDITDDWRHVHCAEGLD